MSLRNRFVLPIIFSSLAVLGGCGGGTNTPVPPPSGGFSNTNFNGTYTFSVQGADVNGTFEMAGSLTACGCSAGTISAGSVDFDDPTVIAPASTIGSNSTYNITSDGRGTAKLYITNAAVSLNTNIEIDFVLTSSSHGLIIRFDSGATGSGTIDLQSTTVGQNALANPYVFSLYGSDLGGNSLSAAGAFTLDSSGNITPAGVGDCNYAATPFYQPTVTGSVVVGSGTTPGVASILTACSSSPFTFDVYAVDATHLKLIESDGVALLVGDLFTQPSSNPIPQGNLVFNMTGFDATSGFEFAAGGIVTSDGTSLLPSGSEDVNDGGLVDGGTSPAVPVSFSGSFAASPSGTGRFTVSLSNFFGGANFVAYPSTGGIFLLEVDSGVGAGITGGVALPQTSGATIAATQGYGLNLTGEDVVNEVELDEIAEFTTTSGGMKGLLDENDSGSVGTSNVSNGTYTNNSNGTGSATVNSNLQSLFFYAADNSTVLFISTDPNQAAAGVIEAQTTPSSQSSLAQARALPMLRTMSHPHLAAAHRKMELIRKH